ncbi:MAG: class I SAM-dependent methyltransferase [Myxococcota bacterium]
MKTLRDAPGPRPVATPSSLFLGQQEALSAAARRGPIVDLACGRGRHALAAAERRWPVIGVDRNPVFLEELGHLSRKRGLRVSRMRTDLETPCEIPLQDCSAGAVLVFRFLHRPLASAIQRLIAPGGVLLYETFTSAQAGLPGGPTNPDFLLRKGELLEMFPELEVVDYAETDAAATPDAPSSQNLARLVARKPA